VCRSLRKRDTPVSPLLVLVSGSQLADLELRNELFDDFCLTPFHPSEVEARLKHLFWRGGDGVRARPRRVQRAGCSTSRPTRRRSPAPLDLTYMEYELLKFLAQHPGKVFTREMLLSRVWGYEYYGGARTVDVHIRRLRAKLGEEHANLIQTVRRSATGSARAAGAPEPHRRAASLGSRPARAQRRSCSPSATTAANIARPSAVGCTRSRRIDGSADARSYHDATTVPSRSPSRARSASSNSTLSSR
jgi:hypothetical protein